MPAPILPRRALTILALGWLVAASSPVVAGPQSPVQDPGDQLWASTYDGPESDDDTAYAIEASPDGTRVFIAGQVNGPGESQMTDFGAVAYDAESGAQLWDKTLGTDGGDHAYALAVSPQGERIYVTGWSAPTGFGPRYVTLALDAATGTKLWMSVYDAGSTDQAFAVAVSPDGTRVFVTGWSYLENYDYATVAYDAATGAQLWASRYGHSIGGDYAQDIAVSPDGSKVFVTGHTEVDRDKDDYGTVAYDSATGATLWAKRFGGSISDYAQALGVSPDGSRVFVTGESDVSFTTVAYEAATGTRQWVKRFGPGKSPAALAVSPDGTGVFVTGYTDEFLNPDFATVAYDPATGARLWSSRYDGFGGGDYPGGLEVSSDGAMVFVTGESAGPAGDEDYATVRYDALTGDQVWASRYDGPAGSFDAAFSLTVAPDGASVFVTGYSAGVATGLDFATVAYST